MRTTHIFGVLVAFLALSLSGCMVNQYGEFAPEINANAHNRSHFSVGNGQQVDVQVVEDVEFLIASNDQLGLKELLHRVLG